MKWVSTILLVVIAVTALAPLSMFTLINAGSDEPSLGTLDVCHSAAPALSVHGEMPCVTASISTAAPLLSESTNVSFQKIFIELILTSRNEQPPQA